MDSDLISRSALEKHFEKHIRLANDDMDFSARDAWNGALWDVQDAPAVGAVDVVRCKDCVKRDQAFRCIALYYGFNPHDDWFCAEGERDNAEVEDART